MVLNLNESEMALFGVPRLRALEMYLTPPTLSERRFVNNSPNAIQLGISSTTGNRVSEAPACGSKRSGLVHVPLVEGRSEARKDRNLPMSGKSKSRPAHPALAVPNDLDFALVPFGDLIRAGRIEASRFAATVSGILTPGYVRLHR